MGIDIFSHNRVNAIPSDHLGRYVDYNGAVLLETYRIIKITPKGVWISMGGYPETKKFVLTSGRRRYAYPNVELAMESYIQRKRHHLGHLARQTKYVEHSLANAKAGRIGYDHQLRESYSSSYADSYY